MSSSDILSLTDTETEEEIVWSRLRKKPTKDETVLSHYKFMESDEDPWTSTSESSYSEELLDPTIRKELGLKNREVALYESLELLKKDGWRSFLQDQYVRYHLLDRPNYIITTCGKIKETKKLWYALWEGVLDIEKMKRGIDIECNICNLDRHATYVAYENLTDENGDWLYDKDGNSQRKIIGYLGRFCYYKFNTLVNLVYKIKISSLLLHKYKINTDEFHTQIYDRIQQLLDKVGAASRITKVEYEKRKRRILTSSMMF